MTQGFENIYDPVKHVVENPTTAPLPKGMVAAQGFTVTLAAAMTEETAQAIYTYLERLGAEYAVFGWYLALHRDMTLQNTPEFMLYASKYITIERTNHGIH